MANLNRLEHLNRLKQAGALTEAEYAEEKGKILSKSTVPSWTKWIVASICSAGLLFAVGGGYLYGRKTQPSPSPTFAPGPDIMMSSKPAQGASAPTIDTQIEPPKQETETPSKIEKPVKTVTSSLDGPWSASERKLIGQWLEANEDCRGGTNPDEVAVACERRDGPLAAELSAVGLCYGRENEYGYQHRMHRCGPGSYR